MSIRILLLAGLLITLSLTHPLSAQNSQHPQSQADAKKPQTVTIQSSIQCGMCQNTIQKALKQVKGVKKVQTSITKSTITVSYKPDQVNLDQIRNTISAAGYDADNVKADPQAYQKLPACCKKPGS
jgi:copper chaperone CopZ